MISFACQRCGMKYQVKDEFAGRATRCTTCKHPLNVPAVNMASPVAAGHVAGLGSTLLQAQVPGGVTLDRAHAAREEPSLVRDVLARNRQSPVRYVIAGEIARGGMGAVLRAVDTDLRREVALKYMLDNSNPAKKARFVEEAQITGQLEHPNIVPIHELGLDAQQRLFFSMKMVKGRSLADALQDRSWTLNKLLGVLVNICHALAYAHSRGVVHRDLKPANVMVGDFGEVYVMDWGLAKILSAEPSEAPIIQSKPVPVFFDSSQSGATVAASRVTSSREQDSDLTQEGSILGTPVYMPPEQATGRINDIDERSDIYALGAILYEILTLLPPIDRNGGHAAVLARVAQGEIVPPDERLRQTRSHRFVPPELSAMAMKALAREKSDRYLSVVAFREDLERYLEGRAVSAKQDSAWETLKKLAKRNKGASLATAFSTLVLIVVVWLFVKANIAARVEAVEERGLAQEATAKAEAALLDLRGEQEARTKQAKDSIPAFVHAARQAINEDRLPDAVNLARIAHGFDDRDATVRLVFAQLHLGHLRFAEARDELATCQKLQPDLEEARKLARLARDANPKNTEHLLALANELTQQKLYPLANRLQKQAETLVQSRQELLPAVQKRLDSAWPGKGANLKFDTEGRLEFNLSYNNELRDLSPLRGMNLQSLILNYNANLQDLSPLQDMPLERLLLSSSGTVKDLRPLQGMKLTHLDVAGTSVEDLTPLRGMPLKELRVSHGVKDISILQGMPLRWLSIGAGELRDLEPLRGMKLIGLELSGCGLIRDFSVLQGMPLEHLDAHSTSFSDLRLLKDMKLRFLQIEVTKVKDLGPLQGMPLQTLNCRFLDIESLEPLRGMPLQSLDLTTCRKLKSLEPLRGMKLKLLSIIGSGITDLTTLDGVEVDVLRFDPRAITRGFETLRKMKSLLEVQNEQSAATPVEEFWKKFDAGEYKK